MKKLITLFIIAIAANLVLTSETFAQVSFRSAATNTGTTTSITVNKPAGVLQNDVLIAVIAKQGNTGNVTTPSGWTFVSGSDLAGGTARNGTVFYKVAGASEPASYTFSLGTGTNHVAATIVAYFGVDISGPTPFDVAPPATLNLGGSGATSATALSATTVTNGAGVVMCAMAAGSNPSYSGWTTTSPGALTEVADITEGNGTDGASAGVAWATKATAGATGNGTASLSSGERNGALLITLKPGNVAPFASLSPSGSLNIAVGGSINFTATAGGTYTGSGNYTYTWTAAGATIPGSNPNNIPGATDTKSLSYAVAGTYTVQVNISRGSTSLNTNTVTINVLAAPASPNLWGIQGNNVVNFSVNSGIDFGPGPSVRFAQTVGTSSAALARTDKPTQVNGYFYWLLNSGTNGVVQVFGSDQAGGSQTAIGSFDVNGASNNNLGFVRLGARADGVIFGLAGDGTTLYLFQFKPNGVTLNSALPAADQLAVTDNNVTLVGGVASTFSNGDICLAGDGNIVALANNGSGLTQIFTGSPNGASTILTKKFDVLDNNGAGFSGSVNGVAFDILGSLYVSASSGLYFINKNTVNGPAATINISLVWAGSGLTDLASNFFPSTIITPVSMSSFTVTRQGNNAQLNWKTLTEVNSDHFVIERSADGINFTAAGSVAAAGNSTNAVNYQYADPIGNASGIIYYRIKTIDFDGSATYSKIVSLRLNGVIVKNFNVFPNPFTSDIKIELNTEKDAAVTIRINNAAGQTVFSRSNQVQKGNNIIVLSSELSALQKGMYVVEVISENEKQTQKIIKR